MHSFWFEKELMIVFIDNNKMYYVVLVALEMCMLSQNRGNHRVFDVCDDLE
jgi:hypothetical protein